MTIASVVRSLPVDFLRQLRLHRRAQLGRCEALDCERSDQRERNRAIRLHGAALFEFRDARDLDFDRVALLHRISARARARRLRSAMAMRKCIWARTRSHWLR